MHTLHFFTYFGRGGCPKLKLVFSLYVNLAMNTSNFFLIGKAQTIHFAQ